MSLFGKLFGGTGSPPAPPLPEPPPNHGFAVDRDRMFDLDLTSRCRALIDMPREQWDEAWQADFYATLWNASIEVPEDNNPFMGPDRFDYLRIDIPAPGPFESNSLANLVDYCLNAGCGAVLFPDPQATEPAFVIPMGVLESLLVYGNHHGDPVDLEESVDAPPDGAVTLSAGSEVIVSTPSASYLSPQAAHALDRYLKDDWQMAEPRVSLMANAEMRPTRSLVINKRLADFATEDDAADFGRRVCWFLPPSRAIILLPDDWSEGSMTPLSQLYES